MRRDGEFLAITLRRKTPSTIAKVEDVKVYSDCNWLVAIYFKGTASDPSSILTCQDYKSNDINERPIFAVEATTVSKIYLKHPESARGLAPLSPNYNIFQFGPATLTPLKFTSRVLQNSGSTTTTPAERMGDFSKVSIGVIGIDPVKATAPLTLDKILPQPPIP